MSYEVVKRPQAPPEVKPLLTDWRAIEAIQKSVQEQLREFGHIDRLSTAIRAMSRATVARQGEG